LPDLCALHDSREARSPCVESAFDEAAERQPFRPGRDRDSYSVLSDARYVTCVAVASPGAIHDPRTVAGAAVKAFTLVGLSFGLFDPDKIAFFASTSQRSTGMD
jgi:hypothetical protein